MRRVIGRNAPCPCGSGKKYKKCCAGKNDLTAETLVDEDLVRIIASAFNQGVVRADAAEFGTYEREWKYKLGNLWNPDELSETISEYFIFVARRDIWKRHLLKILNGTLRSSVRSVVTQWQDPVVLVAKVIEELEDSIIVEEILGTERFRLEKKDDMPEAKGAVIIGVVLRDNRKWGNGLYMISTLLFIQNRLGVFEKEVVALAESSGLGHSNDFYKAHLLDVYHLLVTQEDTSEVEEVEELVHDNLTILQQESLTILEEKLESQNTPLDAQELLKNIIVTYFIMEQPNFRKSDVLAAAVFQVGIEVNILEGLSYTQAEIAKLFGVSVGSIKKHADNITQFALGRFENLKGEVEDVSPEMYPVGTDPQIT